MFPSYHHPSFPSSKFSAKTAGCWLVPLIFLAPALDIFSVTIPPFSQRAYSLVDCITGKRMTIIGIELWGFRNKTHHFEMTLKSKNSRIEYDWILLETYICWLLNSLFRWPRNIIRQNKYRTVGRIINGYPLSHTIKLIERSIISIEIVQTGIILHAHPQVLFCNCVKLYQCWIILKEGLHLQDVDGGTNRLIPIYPQNYLVCRGIVNSKAQLVDLLVVITFSVIKRNLNTGG